MERLTGATVQNLALYQQALTHRSHLRGQPDSHLRSNERLEFLGDAVLGQVVAAYLYHQFPAGQEGFLTRLRAKLVRGTALARFAREIGLGQHVLLSENMAQSDGRDNETILADAFEALVGALYLDRGFTEARAFILRTMLETADLEELAQRHDNHKSLLLEHMQARGREQPRYRVVLEEGPSHDKRFTVEVLLEGVAYGRGAATSKKQAEQLAAREALRTLLNAQ